MFSELFFLHNTDCDQLLDQKKYEEALDCYQQFEKSYSPHDLALVSTRLDEKKSLARLGLSKFSITLTTDALKRKSADTALFYFEQANVLRHSSKNHRPADHNLDSLAPVMARIKYDQIVKEGTLALERRQFTLAVNRLKAAKSLADSNRFDRSSTFDSSFRLAMKNLLIVQLSSSQKKIWANQFDSAQLAIQKTEATAIDFGLLNDPDLEKAVARYKGKIREQQCRNLQDSIDLRLIRADRSIVIRNFMNSMIYLQQALDFARSMPECSIAEKPIVDTLVKYEPATVYQQNLFDARSLVVSGNYEKAIYNLDENQQFYQNNQLNRYGLQMEDIYDFIRERANPYLTEKAISYYAGRENYREALGFLKLAHDQGTQERTVTSIQNQLGQKFAQNDFKIGSLDDARNNVAKYIPDDGWFDPFRASYVNEWRRLVKAAVSGTK